ncbi:MAG: RrF2 family transcriptional regulator [Oribacterium sp.]|nr:RrF2 family transcriptional regulator [Oribacterium sp.]MBO6307287.1 RrF2 family transcriptional regulator [Oribacterium sp.]MBP3804584.1 RrF2 family transcriptional regulator [Oribacterium sp.]MBR1857450.1 RrF2 family transcriptional regulator [Oribacterium sp.]
MMISTKGRYALSTLIDIAQNYDGVTPVSIKEISERQGISIKYLEQIISLMVKGGLLKSIRGAKGGYLFTRPTNEIKVGEILDAAEGTLAPVECVSGSSSCSKAANCLKFPLYKKIDEAIYEVVNKYTLYDLVNDKI